MLMLRSKKIAFQTLRIENYIFFKIEKSANIQLRIEKLLYIPVYIYQIFEIEKMDYFCLRIEKMAWENIENSGGVNCKRICTDTETTN